jgi:uncharacterized tellurite resistance protein B-like protein
MTHKKFYKELGKLLYAVAKSDGKLHPKEVKAIKDLIALELVPMEKSTDEFGSDAAFYAEFEFELMADRSVNPQAAFKSFENFLKEHDKHINEDMRKKAYDLATKVAQSLHGINKEEAVMLEKLRADLHMV